MIYRKRGHTTRWENGTLIRVTESGVATETDLFACHPERSEGPSPLRHASTLPFAYILPS
jgi:hypothetical protein